MTKPWLFLSDIDGTLVRGEIGLAPGVIAAARAYTAAGGLLAVCTCLLYTSPSPRDS